MTSYSPLFQTLHDELRPVGVIGHGTHYSVLRAIAWRDEFSRTLTEAQYLDFAVVWDGDHDERVIALLEDLYVKGLLWPVIFAGERKAFFTLVLSPRVLEKMTEEDFEAYRANVQEVVDSYEDDAWTLNINGIDCGHYAICADSSERVSLYLNTINMLWSLGVKPSS